MTLPVREDDLPHHLDDAEAAGLVERAVDQAGEVIEVDRLVFGERADVDEFVGRGVVERKMGFEDRAQLLALGARHVSVDGRGVDQQRGGGEAVVVVLESGPDACRRRSGRK